MIPALRDRSKPTVLATVKRVLPNEMFLVETTCGDEVSVHASGKSRVAVVRLVPGDEVQIERSPFDPTKGRIVQGDESPASTEIDQ